MKINEANQMRKTKKEYKHQITILKNFSLMDIQI